MALNGHLPCPPASSLASPSSSRIPGLLADVVEEVAQRAAAIVLEELDRREPATRSSAPEFVSVKEAAEILRSDRQRVYDLLSRGKLRRFKDGARTLVRREELLVYIAGDVAPVLPTGSRDGIARGAAA